MGRPHTERLGDAIAEVLTQADLSKSELARRLRVRGFKVDPSIVGKWTRGQKVPPEPLNVIPAIEEEAGVRRGTIFELAGYVSDGRGLTVEEAIARDPNLTPDNRAFVLRVYRFATQDSAALVK